MKKVVLILWGIMLVLACGYLVNNFMSLNDWVDAEMTIIREGK